MNTEPVITIQKTSKKIKGQQIGVLGLFVVGFLTLGDSGGVNIGLWILALAVVLQVYVSFMKWWHHG